MNLMIIITAIFLAIGFWNWVFFYQRIRYEKKLQSRDAQLMATRYGDLAAIAERLKKVSQGSKMKLSDYYYLYLDRLVDWLQHKRRVDEYKSQP